MNVVEEFFAETRAGQTDEGLRKLAGNLCLLVGRGSGGGFSPCNKAGAGAVRAAVSAAVKKAGLTGRGGSFTSKSWDSAGKVSVTSTEVTFTHGSRFLRLDGNPNGNVLSVVSGRALETPHRSDKLADKVRGIAKKHGLKFTEKGRQNHSKADRAAIRRSRDALIKLSSLMKSGKIKPGFIPAFENRKWAATRFAAALDEHARQQLRKRHGHGAARRLGRSSKLIRRTMPPILGT